MKKSKKSPSNIIALNKKARHDYFIEDTYETGLVLEGWEVKSLRAGRGQISESYVILKHGAAWLLGSHINALVSTSTHVKAIADRSRKLLLHQAELDKLYGAIERRGYTLVPIKMYWQRGRAKLEIGLAKGKKQHDKRATIKERDWAREKNRLLKKH